MPRIGVGLPNRVGHPDHADRGRSPRDGGGSVDDPRLSAAGAESERTERVGFGLFGGQLLTIFGLALSNAFLVATLLWAARATSSLRHRLAEAEARRLLWPLGLYVALFLGSVALSYQPIVSLGHGSEVLALALVPVAILFVRGEERVRMLVHGVIGIGTLFAAIGLFQLWLRRGGLELQSRITGPVSHYQTLAGILLLADVALIATLVYRRSSRRWYSVLALVLLNWALIATLTRGAWVALGITLVIAVVIRAPKALLGLVPLALVLTLMLPARVVDRAVSIFDPSDPSNYDRLCMAYSGLLMIEERPLFGIGPGMVVERYPIYRHPTAPKIARPHLHNAFLQVAAERGLPALVAFAWLLFASLSLAWRRYRSEGGPHGGRADLLMVSMLGLIAFSVAGLFEDNWGDTEVQRIVLFALSIPACLGRTETGTREDSDSDERPEDESPEDESPEDESPEHDEPLAVPAGHHP